MINITLSNGAKYSLTGLTLHGKYIDSDGTPAPGSCPIAYTESDIGRLNSIVPLQGLFTAFAAPDSDGGTPGDSSSAGTPEGDSSEGDSSSQPEG